MLPGTHFYSWYSYSKNSRFIPGITVIPGIIYSSFQEPAPGCKVFGNSTWFEICSIALMYRMIYEKQWFGLSMKMKFQQVIIRLSVHTFLYISKKQPNSPLVWGPCGSTAAHRFQVAFISCWSNLFLSVA